MVEMSTTRRNRRNSRGLRPVELTDPPAGPPAIVWTTADAAQGSMPRQIANRHAAVHAYAIGTNPFVAVSGHAALLCAAFAEANSARVRPDLYLRVCGSTIAAKSLPITR